MLTIYRSSAGSGKTYTLVKEYILLSFKSPKNFKKILAITFTKKSTYELKRRVLSTIHQFSMGIFDSIADEILKKYNWSTETLKQESKSLLSRIVYNYDKLAIKTIDSFFQDLLLNFSIELGIGTRFNIETDINHVAEIIIENIFKTLQKNPYLLKYLTKFAENRILNGQKWSFEKELLTIIKETLSEKFINYEQDLLKFSNNPNSLEDYIKNINESIKKYEDDLSTLGKNAVKNISDENLLPEDFSYGKNGVAGYFLNLSNNIIKKPSIRILNLLQHESKWYSQSSQKKEIVSKLATSKLKKILKLAIQYIEDNQTKIHSYLSVKPYIYLLGLTGNILKLLEDYRKEFNTILISDTLNLLKKIMLEGNIDFIYEKIGNTYNHILIDEFQDVSQAQWDNLYPIIENSISQGGKVTLVGDPKQSIYRWRNADSSLIIKAENAFNKNITNVIFLESNWRSNEKIIHFNNTFFNIARNFLKNNLENELRCYFPNNPEIYNLLQINYSAYKNLDQKTNILNCNKFSEIAIEYPHNKTNFNETILSYEQEIIFTINKIKKLQDNKIKDIGILVRNNSQAQIIANGILNYKSKVDNTPYDFSYELHSKSTLKSSFVIKFLILTLDYLLEKENIILKEIAFLYNFHIINNKDIVYEDFFLLANESLEKLLPKQFTSLCLEIHTTHLYDLVNKVIDLFSLRKHKKNSDLDLFCETLLDFCEKEIANLEKFLQWWKSKGNNLQYEKEEDNSNIKIMTIHQSKGLQFDAVIMPFCNWDLDHSAQNSPLIWCKNEKTTKDSNPPVVCIKYSKKLIETYFRDEYLKEKINIHFDNLNLLYVAFTRAKTCLYLFLEDKEKSFKTIKDIINQTLDNSEIKISDDTVVALP